MMLKKDASVEKLYVEIKSGVGGKEAALFSFEIFQYLIGIADKFSFEVDVFEEKYDEKSDGMQALLNAAFFVRGAGSFTRLEIEAGVHRVQRKPITDRSRMHTSTCAVTVGTVYSTFIY